jgi:tetratricopeptide (TPR) repeat protein
VLRQTKVLLCGIFGLSAACYADGPDKETCRLKFESFKEAAAKNPADDQAWTSLRQCTTLLKKWNEAAVVAQAVIAQKPDAENAHLLLGITEIHMQEYSKASEEFTKATELKPDQALPFYYLGMAQLYLNQPDDAVKAAERAAALEPNNAIHYSQIAYAHLLMDDREQAEDAAKKAIELDHNNVAAYKVLGNLYAKEGNQKLSQQMYEEAIHANGRLVSQNPFVPDKRELPGMAPGAKTASTPVAVSSVPVSTMTVASVPAAPAAGGAAEVPAAAEPASQASVTRAAVAAAAAAATPAVHVPKAIPGLREDEAPPPAEVKKNPVGESTSQWNNMKNAIVAGNTEKALGYFSDYAGTRDQYRASFQNLGLQRVQQIFSNMGELDDCQSVLSSVTCKAPLRGAQGTFTETNVRFERSPDDGVWRIRSF